MTTYKCPTCRQPAPKPLWLIAREKGFDNARDCIVVANKTGNVTPCIRAEVGPLCDFCAVGIALGVGKK